MRIAAKHGPPFMGQVLADMGIGAKLLQQGAVLASGARASGFPNHIVKERIARLHLVQREIGFIYPTSEHPFVIENIVNKRIASRPSTAGVRAHFDKALKSFGIDAYELHCNNATIHESHLEVVLAVVSGKSQILPYLPNKE
ncbi:MAG: hypothetical protein JW841_16110 [Deltaproteobacteria bacterium]|nr:hypothetical protein [Deltaproteobacteria bacterium]